MKARAMLAVAAMGAVALGSLWAAPPWSGGAHPGLNGIAGFSSSPAFGTAPFGGYGSNGAYGSTYGSGYGSYPYCGYSYGYYGSSYCGSYGYGYGYP